MIGCHWWGWDTRALAIGWCHEVPLRLVLDSRSSGQMMADLIGWCLSAPLRLSVIICDKAVPWVLWGPQVVKIGTTHNLGSSLRVMVGNLSRPESYKTMLGRSCRGAIASRVGSQWSQLVTLLWAMCHCFQDQFCQDLCLMRPWYGCCQWLPVVTRQLCLKLRYH